MKRNKRIANACILLFFFVSFSCKKEKEVVHVSGYILENVSRRPIPFASVYLLKETVEFGSNPKYEILDVMYSDSSGYYSFNSDLSRSDHYEIRAVKNQYINDGNNRSELNVTKKNELICDVVLIPYAYFRLKMRGSKGAARGLFELGEGARYAELRAGEDSLFYGVCRGNVANQLRYWKYDVKDTVLEKGSVEVKIPALDTIDIHFEF
ncbi:MAG TPA: hypothetical protein VGF79_12710 [Bacteroidia bacterium]